MVAARGYTMRAGRPFPGDRALGVLAGEVCALTGFAAMG